MGKLEPKKNKRALERAAKARALKSETDWTEEKIAVELECSVRTVRYDLKRRDVPPALIERAEKRIKEGKGLSHYKHRDITLKDKQIDIITFCEDSAYLNFQLNPMQKLILKAFYSLPLTKKERKELVALQKEGKTTWEEGQKYRELVLVAGMKAGKTTLVSVIACYEEFSLYRMGEPWKEYGFPEGEQIFIINVATSRGQAEDTIYAQTLARIKHSPFYRERPYKAGGRTITMEDSGVNIRCGHSNSASIVGKLAKCVELDELARFKDKGGKSSAEAVYTSLPRSVEPFGQDGRIVSISSPIWEKDKIMRLYKLSAKIPNMLGFKLATWEMNPNITREKLKWEFKKDPAAAARDFGADPSKPKEGYYRIPSKIEEAFERAKTDGAEPAISSEGKLRADFKPSPDVDYYLHGDPAARNDAFGLALGHRLGKKPWLDLAHAFEAGEGEIDVEEIKNVILELVKRGFRIKKATFDTWGAVSVWQALKAKNITVENLYVLKEQHDALKQAIYQDNLQGLFPAKLRDELRQLVLERGLKVDHPSGGSKDMADAAAAVVWHCMGENGEVEPAGAGKDPSPEGGGMGGWLARMREKREAEHRFITERRPRWQ